MFHLLLQGVLNHGPHHLCDGQSAQIAGTIVDAESEAKQAHETDVVKVVRLWGEFQPGRNQSPSPRLRNTSMPRSKASQ